MSQKTNELLWSISLMLIGIIALIFSVTSIAGIGLPDILVRILGITDLLLLPVFVCTSVLKLKKRRK